MTSRRAASAAVDELGCGEITVIVSWEVVEIVAASGQ
jgi:hypothetical protein